MSCTTPPALFSESRPAVGLCLPPALDTHNVQTQCKGESFPDLGLLTTLAGKAIRGGAELRVRRLGHEAVHCQPGEVRRLLCVCVPQRRAAQCHGRLRPEGPRDGRRCALITPSTHVHQDRACFVKQTLAGVCFEVSLDTSGYTSGEASCRPCLSCPLSLPSCSSMSHASQQSHASGQPPFASRNASRHARLTLTQR